MLFINEKEIKTNGYFGYDGCHKIYICEDDGDIKWLKDYGYDILPIENLPLVWENSCPLRFIYNAKLSKYYVEQCESAKITWSK